MERYHKEVLHLCLVFKINKDNFSWASVSIFSVELVLTVGQLLNVYCVSS